MYLNSRDLNRLMVMKIMFIANEQFQFSLYTGYGLYYGSMEAVNHNIHLDAILSLIRVFHNISMKTFPVLCTI
jgi:hypothetical protein